MWDITYCKLEIFLPQTHLSALQHALAQAGAGHIGNYDCCLSYSPVTSCWRPLSGTHPYLGTTGELCTQPEIKVEVVCSTDRLDQTLQAIKAVHPYEEPVINVIPLLKTGL